jgi:tetratricopeptide (TPR) repeat protein/transcriptional regulator with XRE-family HTH domain
MAARRQRLAMRRKAVGFSQEALAALLDVERSTVVRWESGETNPLPWIRPKLAGALAVSTDQLDALLEAAPERPATEHEGSSWRGSPAEMAMPAASLAESRSPVCQLPPAVADFTGRQPQAARLTEILGGDGGNRVGVPVAMIVGLPGVGKTTLALQVAHTLRPEFPDGQLWVPLQGGSGRPRDPGEVLGELCRAMGVPGAVIPSSVGERAALYRSVLAGRRVLVLADDAATAAQVEPLLPGTGQCAVLVTSRSELASPPASRLVQLDPLTTAEAVDLLARIVGEQRVTAEPGAAAQLAISCGLLPLAVRIAGARLAARTSWPLSTLARKITHARHRLDELQAGEMSVRASLNQAYHALDEPVRCAFRRLALLDGGDFTEWQVAALMAIPDASAVVNRLAESSLLTATGVDPVGQARYRVHDLVRDYAAEQLTGEPTAERDAALDRLTSGWLQLAALADGRLPNEPFFPPAAASSTAMVAESEAEAVTADPTAWLTTERLGLHAAIARCCATGRHHAAAQLAASMAGFWHLQGRPDDAESAWQAVAAATRNAADPAFTAHAQLRLAAAVCAQGRHAQASPIVGQCIAAFSQLAGNAGLASAHYWQATCEWNLGNYAAARAAADRCLQQAKDNGDRQTEPLALRLRALAIADAKPPGYAEDSVISAERALALARELGNPALEHEVLHTLASVYTTVGRHEDALHRCQDGIDLARELGIKAATAEWLGIRGDAYRGLGRYREAAESLQLALPTFRDHFMVRHHGLCLLKLGYTYQAIGDHQAAISYLEESQSIFGTLHLDHYIERARAALQRCQAESGKAYEKDCSSQLSGST